MSPSGGHRAARVRAVDVPVARISRVRARSAARVTAAAVRRTAATATAAAMADVLVAVGGLPAP